MRFLRTIFLLSLFAPSLLRGQPAVQLPPGGAAQLMVPQPAVDVSPVENVSAKAAFEPAVVRVGEKTFYRVAVDATQNAIDWPDVLSAPSELKLGNSVRGQISRMEGNKFSPLTSFVYEVIPTAVGQFTLPSFGVQANGQAVTVPTATLTVVESNATPVVPTMRQLWMEVSQTNLFVGQPFRARVILMVGIGNQVEMLREIQINGSGFMTDKMATRQGPERVVHNGQSVQVFLYETTVTPLAAGSLTMSAQGFSAGNDFGGPISINGQGGQIVIMGGPPRYSLLVSDETHLNVRPLPVERELPGFTGAIGLFRPVKPQLSVNQVRVGEPLHLKYGFESGTNLNRFVPPEAPHSREWQIIADPLPGSGFTMIPLTDEVTETPPIPFSAFDPAKASYYDLSIPALPVTVAGDGLPVQMPVWSSTETNSAPLKLSGLVAKPGKTVASLKPLQLRWWFVCLQILPVLALIALWRWDERRRFLEAHPDIVRRRQAKRDLRREKVKMQRAASAGDGDGFVRHAATALRIAVAPHLQADSQALVGADVLAQMSEAERNGTAGETVRMVFSAIDVQFAAIAQVRADLLGLRADLDAVLEKMEEKL